MLEAKGNDYLEHTSSPLKEIPTRALIIAIDGPARTGKGATVELLKERLGDSAVVFSPSPLYRGLAWYFLHHPVFTMSPEGEIYSGQEELLTELDNIQLDYKDGKVSINGIELGEDILRSYAVDVTTPEIAKIKIVQDRLIAYRRKIVEDLVSTGKTVIVEGRNEGSDTFPDANAKIYLYADSDMRVRREMVYRLHKLEEQKVDIYDRPLGNHDIQAAKFYERLTNRDTADIERPHYPLVTEPEKYGYELVDNSLLTIEETVDEIMSVLRNNNLLKPSI
jgi:CMP/dCMP kinase